MNIRQNKTEINKPRRDIANKNKRYQINKNKGDLRKLRDDINKTVR